MSALNEKDLSNNRFAYIIEAAVEYFISLLITDTFISNLLLENGVSAASTGIIIQLASFAFVAQLFSVFYRRNSKMKAFVTITHLVNQLLFALLYMVPGINLPQNVKIILLIVMFLGGHILSSIISPYKISWLMSFVADKDRGKFTATKEIVSLISGIIFQLVMANKVDHYMKIGNYTVAFNLCAFTILVMAIVHFVCLLAVKEDSTLIDEKVHADKSGIFDFIKQMFKNTDFLKVVLIIVIWHVITGMSASFYGSYKLKTLDFTIFEATILACVSAMIRALVSRKFGKYADKYSWSKLLYVSFIIVAIAYLANVFVIEGHLKIMFIIYSVVHGISMAGINSGVMNILFDFVTNEQRSAALGICNSLGGIISFLTALIGGFILASIQNGNDKSKIYFTFFDFDFGMYGQQVLSLISFIICVVLIIYMKNVILKISNN